MAQTNRRRNQEVKAALTLAETAVSRLREEGFRISKAYLFGSFATGVSGEWSDIDVAFISPDYRPADFGQWARIATICQKIDIRMEPVLYRPADFPNKDPLASEIHRTGIPLLIPRHARRHLARFVNLVTT